MDLEANIVHNDARQLSKMRRDITRWWGKDSNLRSLRNRFTAGSRWPLRYPTLCAPPQHVRWTQTRIRPLNVNVQ